MNSFILKFASIVVGKYTNKIQSIENPRLFAHTNMFFQPIPSYIYGEPMLYSEQSYDYLPWSPYRQTLHKLKGQENKIIIENYSINEPIYIAGSGFMPELLHCLKNHNLIKREGCSMTFQEINDGFYKGVIEEGNNCIISHSGKRTYLSSRVEFKNKTCSVIDEGFDIKTKNKIWGSNYGPIIFNKTTTEKERLYACWKDHIS